MNIKTIVAMAGGSSKLAKALGLHHSTVIGWKNVPSHHVLTVSKLIDVPCEELLVRDDLPTEQTAA